MGHMAAPTPRTDHVSLEVPASAIVALVNRGYEPDDGAGGEQIAEDIRVIAAPVVAAELRRLAHDVLIPAGSRDEAAVLLGRAAALDVGAR
jgi:hypothetical protein